MGKTAAGAVWLDPALVSPYEYWQFWRNTEDADVGRFLKLFTELPLSEIGRLASLGGAELNEAKKILATEATALLHGRAAAVEAAEAARSTFEEGGSGSALPTIEVPLTDLAGGLSIAALFVRAGLASSNGEVRRAVANNALSVNGTRVTDAGAAVTASDVTADGMMKLSHGRKKHVLVRVIEDGASWI
jgi:tyrosyl-tRNA synthetase